MEIRLSGRSVWLSNRAWNTGIGRQIGSAEWIESKSRRSICLAICKTGASSACCW